MVGERINQIVHRLSAPASRRSTVAGVLGVLTDLVAHLVPSPGVESARLGKQGKGRDTHQKPSHRPNHGKKDKGKNKDTQGRQTRFAAEAASVEAAAQFGWAYLLANQSLPVGGSYTPTRTYQFNSTGAINTVVRTGTGAYTARLPNLGVAAGTVQVTAVGSLVAGNDASGPGSCKVASWRPNGTTQEVSVRCFTLDGSPTDGVFALTYVNLKDTPQPTAYLWADKPTTASYTPSLTYQFNSTKAKNTVTRTGTGAYTARLPNLGTDGTVHVQVTAYGSGNGRCQVAGWGRNGTAEEVKVRCFNGTGVAADTKFTLSHVSGISLVGSPFSATGSGTASAYVLADQPSALSSYTPRSVYRFNSSGATNTITREKTGVYRVNFPGQTLDRGTVLVSVFGAKSAHCKVASWSSALGLQVRCFTRAGTPRDTAFTAAFLASTGLAQRVAVPSYFVPSPRWDTLRAGVPPVGLAVINPAGFDQLGYSQEPAYVDQVDLCKAKGLLVLGYVDTDYGKDTKARPECGTALECVKALVDQHYTMYGVDGIFFDQVWDDDDPTKLAYYKALYDHVKTKSGQRVVVINPGKRTTESYIRRADIIINFEGYYVAPPVDPPKPGEPPKLPLPSYATGTANPWQLPSNAWEWKYPAERFWHLVHTTTAEADMLNAIRLSKQRNAGWVYVTDDALLNPSSNIWDRLPGESTNAATYWTKERAAVAAV
ncbi:MAG: spherulation-specific family 4 protein [Thermomicrobiales bacterium]